MGTRREDAMDNTPGGLVEVVGLVRPSEPKGGYMRPNQPDADIWTSRDLAAIAHRRHVNAESGWFIDAQTIGPAADQVIASDVLAKQPKAGLTVISFPNNHLSYALTWFTLALLSLGGSVLVYRHRR